MTVAGWKLQTIPIADATFSGKKHCGIPNGSWTSLDLSVRPVVNFNDAASARRWRRLYMGYEQCLVQVLNYEPQVGESPNNYPSMFGGGLYKEGLVIPCFPYGVTWTQLANSLVSEPVTSPDDVGTAFSRLWWNVNCTKGFIGGSLLALAVWHTA